MSKNEYEKVKALLKEEQKKNYNKNYIDRILREKSNIRKVFLSVIRNNPCLIHEITRDILLSKPTCYNQLNKLMGLNLIERIYVIDLKTGKLTTNKEIKIKWDKFSERMPENSKRYFIGRTSFFVITDFGKEFANKAYEFEKEFKEGEEFDYGVR